MLITLEGIDGSGKTTQAKLLLQALENRGIKARLHREPGGTQLGEKLRELLKAGAVKSPVAEILLFCAARAELILEKLTPALEDGEWIVLDRFLHSTLAYQGALAALPLDLVEQLAGISACGLVPNLALWIDLPVAEALARIGAERDALELRGSDYLGRVREIYAGLADLGALERIEGSGREDVVARAIWAAVSSRFQLADED